MKNAAAVDCVDAATGAQMTALGLDPVALAAPQQTAAGPAAVTTRDLGAGKRSDSAAPEAIAANPKSVDRVLQEFNSVRTFEVVPLAADVK